MLAEVAPRRALPAIGQPRLIDAQVLLALDLKRAGVAAQVDGVAAAPRRLAADRAVAMHVGLRRRRLEREPNRAAMARTFQLHGGPPGFRLT